MFCQYSWVACHILAAISDHLTLEHPLLVAADYGTCLLPEVYHLVVEANLLMWCPMKSLSFFIYHKHCCSYDIYRQAISSYRKSLQIPIFLLVKYIESTADHQKIFLFTDAWGTDRSPWEGDWVWKKWPRRGCVRMTDDLFAPPYQWPFQEPKLEVPTIYKAYIRPMKGNIPTKYSHWS